MFPVYWVWTWRDRIEKRILESGPHERDVYPVVSGEESAYMKCWCIVDTIYTECWYVTLMGVYGLGPQLVPGNCHKISCSKVGLLAGLLRHTKFIEHGIL